MDTSYSGKGAMTVYVSATFSTIESRDAYTTALDKGSYFVSSNNPLVVYVETGKYTGEINYATQRHHLKGYKMDKENG